MRLRRLSVMAGALLLTCVFLRAETIYSTFGIGGADGTGGGYSMGCCWGPLGGGFFAVAVPFVPSADYTLDTIRIPLRSRGTAPQNQFTFEIREGITQPVTVLERHTRALTGFSIVELNSSAHPVLYSGKRYWVVVSTEVSGEWGWGSLEHPPGTVMLRNTPQMTYWKPFDSNIPGVHVAGTPTTVRKPTTLFEDGGSVPHVLAGGGWQTNIQLMNTGSTSATAALAFYDEAGSALSLPVSYSEPQRSITASSISETIAAGATLSLTLSDPGPLLEGHAKFSTNGDVGALTFIRYNPTGQEVGVPLETRNANAYLLAFDHSDGITTGIAVANLSTLEANIPVTVRDAGGALLAQGTIVLPRFGQASFSLTEKYPATNGKQGSIQFETPEFGSISLFGLRTVPIDSGRAFSMTTIPVVAR
jgi:hypothetical protein